MTELTYLTDTYLFRGTSQVIRSGKNEHGNYIILDCTIFYPQGGGQPSDTGIIEGKNGKFEVNMVRLDENGIVYHYGIHTKGILEDNEIVTTHIDSGKRITNARNHSAGHLIDIAMRRIGMGHLKPCKGYHFSEGPYVEYQGVLQENTETIAGLLERELINLINQKLIMVVNYREDVESPLGKQPRYVHFEGYPGCGCGGTHVRHSGEIKQMTIRKIKMKDGNIRISYSV